MYKFQVQDLANRVEKQMKRYIKMMTTMDVQVYEELKYRGFEMELVGSGNSQVLVVIYRK